MSRALYEYALLRVTPSLARGEQLNIGVVLHCQQAALLEVALHVDEQRLAALAPSLELAAVLDAAAGLQEVARGVGPAGELSLGQRFRWLTAPRSTLLQTGPAHTGLSADPPGEAARLLTLLVR